MGRRHISTPPLQKLVDMVPRTSHKEAVGFGPVRLPSWAVGQVLLDLTSCAGVTLGKWASSFGLRRPALEYSVYQVCVYNIHWGPHILLSWLPGETGRAAEIGD